MTGNSNVGCNRSGRSHGSRRLRRWAWRGITTVLFAQLLACASSGAPSAEQPQQETLSEGDQCLKDAALPRDPKPDAPSKVSVKHILVRHSELTDPRGATRSPEQACLRALEALRALEGGASWSEAEQKYNDAADDSLGRIARDDVTAAFADAAFALEVDQLSYVVETDRGFHIILRER